MAAARWALWLSLLSGCGRRAEALDAPGQAAAPSAQAQAPGVGGLWVTCYAHFRPRGLPGRDLERLAQGCGSPLGMTPASPVWQGRLSGGVVEHGVSLERGQCVRVFAVGAVRDLDLALVDPDGRLLGEDGIDDAWPVLPPDGTLCALRPGQFTVRVSARGEGDYAAQLWRLR